MEFGELQLPEPAYVDPIAQRVFQWAERVTHEAVGNNSLDSSSTISTQAMDEGATRVEDAAADQPAMYEETTVVTYANCR